MTTDSEAATESFQMAMDLLQSGDLHGAIRHLSRSLQFEERANTYVERAKLLHAIGNLEDATEDLERAIGLCEAAGVSAVQYAALGRQMISLRDQIMPKTFDGKTEREKLMALVSSKNVEGLLEHFDILEFREEILASAETSVRIRLSADPNDVSTSKFGGLPHLPRGFTWPAGADRMPLAFLAQIDLSELPESSLIGNSGMLSFFYNTDEEPWGLDPKDREQSKVLFFPSSEHLVKTSCPTTLRTGFIPCAIEFHSELSFPDSTITVPLNYRMGHEYDLFCEEWYGMPIHRLLGHPQLIQYDWRENCQLASNGINIGDSVNHDSEEIRTLQRGASNWKLLLQIDSDELPGMQWGDDGRLYFCIEKQALAEKDFQNVWTILQCL